MDGITVGSMVGRGDGSADGSRVGGGAKDGGKVTITLPLAIVTDFIFLSVSNTIFNNPGDVK